MQNLQTNEALLQNFQVEELEERLENAWTCYCGVERIDQNTQQIVTTYVECDC